MKAVILAGGFGTRISEETQLKPKPMVEIGGRPILWHIMKIYSHWGINDFIICCGYRGFVIKEYFANYFLHNSDVTFDIAKQSTEIHQNNGEPWRVTLVDTGETSGTGGRLKRVAHFLDNSPFCLTYGDGVGDINIEQSLRFHQKQKALVTVTAVQPPSRFGNISFNENGLVENFAEKSLTEDGWISGGFFIMEREFIDFIADEHTILEKEPMQRVTKAGRLAAYKHHGFWQCMDTLRDNNHLNNLWSSGAAPWKIWDSKNLHAQQSNNIIFSGKKTLPANV